MSFTEFPRVSAIINTSDTGDQPSQTKLPPELAPETDARTDRVLSTRVQTFSSIVHRFQYEAARSMGHVEVAGAPPMVSTSSNWRPLRTRQALAAATALGLGLLGLVLVTTYTAIHSWYASYGHPGLVAALALLLGLFLAVMVAGLLLPRRLWTPARVWAPLGLAALTALGAGIAWRIPAPSAEGARRALAEKNDTRASIEARALIDLGLDRGAGAAIFDDLHLARAQAAEDFDTLAAVVKEPWNLDDRRQIALNLLRAAAEEKRAVYYPAKKLAALVGLAQSTGELDPALRDNLAAHAALVHAEQCIAENDCACVAKYLEAATPRETLKSEAARIRAQAGAAFAATLKQRVTSAAPAPARDPHLRQTTLKEALALAQCFSTLMGTPPDPPPPALEQQLVQVNREVEAADKRSAALAAQEASRQKAKEAAEDAQKKAQEAAEERARREANRGLLCGDGTISSCPCQGSHRGCCSHHKGVAGCEPL